MAKKEQRNLFSKLTKLFRSGPVVKRKIRALDTTSVKPDTSKSSGTLLFQKSLSPTYATITSNAYNLSERLMRYQDFCFGGDVIVYTLDGAMTFKELVERYPNGERFFVYSYDYELKQPVIGTAFCPRLAREGKKSSLLRVKFDDGGYVDVTPDHKMVLRDGSTREAKDLKVNDSLMPLNVNDITDTRYSFERDEVTFSSIVDACSAFNGDISSIMSRLYVSRSRVEQLLRDKGFNGLSDVMSRLNEAHRLATHLSIERETRRPTLLEIQYFASVCQSIDEAAARLRCSRHAVNTCLSLAGHKDWDQYRSNFYHQDIGKIHVTGDRNITDIEVLDDDFVYTVTVEKHHNLAVGIANNYVFATQSEMEYCLDSTTCIPTVDGMVELGELARRCDADPDYQFIVYSYDHEKQEIVPAFGKQARQTRVDHAWKVTFDSGKTITGSGNHRLMMRDGTYREIRDLQPGDSMMPFYRKDFYADGVKGTPGYSWIYNMNKWVAEHRLIAEWVEGRQLTDDEVVHHVNFVKSDNRPENLQVMTRSAHSSYHAGINNDHKWDTGNSDWIEKFKRNHAVWMRDNAPTSRKDVTFGKILEVSECLGFDLAKVSKALDVDKNVIYSRLADNGFSTYESFTTAYKFGNIAVDGKRSLCVSDLDLETVIATMEQHDSKQQVCIKLGCTVNVLNKFLDRKAGVSWTDLRKQKGWSDEGHRGGRPKGMNGNALTFQQVCDAYVSGMSLPMLAEKLSVNKNTIVSRIAQHGFKKYSEFQSSYENHKVVSVEYVGVIPLFDFTVDGYKNFATDSVISHNTPEIAGALDIYADETVAQDDMGKVLHVYSENEKIKETLEELFYDTLNVEFNARSWVRNLPLHKDTLIPLLDGRNITIEQLSNEFVAGKENWVYSVQDGTHRTVPGKVTWCGLTRKDSELVRVTLDDNTYVDCTPDHEFIMRDGSSKRADQLTPGLSMMPFYRRVSDVSRGDKLNGYERVYDPRTDAYVYTHSRVAEILPEGKLNGGRWLVTHHIDFDKRNNDPKNLVRIDDQQHIKMHGEHGIKVLQRPDVIVKRMIGIDSWLRSNKHRDIARQQLIKLQDRGLMRKSWDDYNRSEQFVIDHGKRSAASIQMWNVRRDELRRSMSIKVDARCLDMMIEKLRESSTYQTTVEFGRSLIESDEFVSHFYDVNKGTRRDLRKSLRSHAGITTLLNRLGIDSYPDFVKQFAPELHAQSCLKTGRNFHKSSSRPLNHKVLKVERLQSTSDVYCMTVVGPNDEHDRHNFAVITAGGSVDNGTFVSNCKYGDAFLYIDVDPKYGVVNAFPIPVNEIEREENFDREDPFAVRFRWVTMGNRTLENWEIAHFRLLGNDMFIPYGSSIIEPARRIWRQLILIEDAMLVYRVCRAPERRVFYIDVANVPAENVPMYIEEQKKNLRSSQVIDGSTGRVDLRYNPMSVEEDYFMPVRGAETGTKIDTLKGGENTAAVEDVAYIQKKLFAALKIPRAYLGYDDALASKATLAQEDIRFSRTINVIQKTLIAELNKIAIIHLYAHGFDGEDLQNFTLRLSNPSSIAQQQKLELWRAKFEIGGSMPEGMGSATMVQRDIWGLTPERIMQLRRERMEEQLFNAQIEAAVTNVSAGGGGAGGDDLLGDLGGGGGGGAPPKPPAGGGGGEKPPAGGEKKTPPPETAGEIPDEEEEPELELLTSADDAQDGEERSLKRQGREAPLKAVDRIKHYQYNRSRIDHGSAGRTHMPNFAKMTGNDNDAMKDPSDSGWMKSLVSNPFSESAARSRTVPTKSMLSMLVRMRGVVRPQVSDDSLLTEGIDVIDDMAAEGVDAGIDVSDDD